MQPLVQPTRHLPTTNKRITMLGAVISFVHNSFRFGRVAQALGNGDSSPLWPTFASSNYCRTLVFPRARMRLFNGVCKAGHMRQQWLATNNHNMQERVRACSLHRTTTNDDTNGKTRKRLE